MLLTKKIILFSMGFVVLGVFNFSPPLSQAQTLAPEDGIETEAEEMDFPEYPPDEFFRGTVQEIIEEGVEEIPGGYTEVFQKLRIELEHGQVIELENRAIPQIERFFEAKLDQRIVVVKTHSATGREIYAIADTYRLPQIYLIAGLFFLLAILIAGIRGFTSIIGLMVSLLILTTYIVPRIIAGDNPLVVSLLGALAIAVVALYLAHGFSKQTSIALGSTVIVLVFSVAIASIFVSLAQLTGMGSEEALYLQAGVLQNINLRGLLLGGIIIGALGVLDDITVSQTAAIFELHRANPSLSRKELYTRGWRVGREHIASLINTLVLAYAGAAMPLFLLIVTNKSQPLWVTLNSELVIEEVIRSLVGSAGLILAVPIATMLAAYAVSRKKLNT